METADWTVSDAAFYLKTTLSFKKISTIYLYDNEYRFHLRFYERRITHTYRNTDKNVYSGKSHKTSGITIFYKRIRHVHNFFIEFIL